MRDQYLIRRDVLDRIHQNPNAVPIVYPDEFGAILQAAGVPAVARDMVAQLGLPTLSEAAQARLANLDKQGLVDNDVKANRDLMGFLDRRSYDDASAESYAAWAVLWEGIRQWDNRQWDWNTVATGVALVALFCPVVEQREAVVIGHGSTAH